MAPSTRDNATPPSKLVVCSHCSALLLVSLTPGQVATTSRPDPPPARKSQQVTPEEEAADLIRRINDLDRRWSRRWPILGSTTLSRAEWIQRWIALTTLVVIAVGVLASYWSRISHVIPIVAGILGLAG